MRLTRVHETCNLDNGPVGKGISLRASVGTGPQIEDGGSEMAALAMMEGSAKVDEMSVGTRAMTTGS